MNRYLESKKYNDLSLQDKQDILFDMFDMMNILPDGTKEVVEGIIIGLNIKENLELSNKIEI